MTLPPQALAAVLATALACAPPELSQDEKLRRVEELYASYQLPDVPELTAEELAGLLGRDDVVVVDVREEGERAVSTIPGALSKAELEGDAEAYRGSRIVAYCTIGYRSGFYADELRRRGFDAWNLRGSILAWTHAGQPLVDENGATRRLHVYGAQWDLAADGYEAVW